MPAATHTTSASCPPPVRIGTSGWSYNPWRGSFYPRSLPAGEWLPWYARQFSTVEINNVFYHLPEARALDQWRQRVPEHFIFSIKASRFITHMKKLSEPSVTLPPFIERITRLDTKLGPILFQLPARWYLHLDRLKVFLQALDGRYRYAFEFRDPAWFDDSVYAALATHRAAWCIYDLNRILSPLTVTTDFVYIRLHGSDGPYCGHYDDHALSIWAERINEWRRQGKQVYCYFNNDQLGYAPQNASRLQRMLMPDQVVT